MSPTLSERRMAENEVVFRQYNETIQEGFDELKRIAQEDGQNVPFEKDDPLLHFYCECSDENCRKRIQLKSSRYNEIHKKRDRFVIIPGHEVDSIEKVISKEADYYVVKKFIIPPEDTLELKTTNVHNI